MDDSPMQAVTPALRRAAPLVIAVLLGTAGLAYAIHEGHAAQGLAVRNQQVTEELNVTNSQLRDLAAKVSAMTAQAPPQPATPSVAAPAPPASARLASHARKPRAGYVPDRRYSRLQKQIDAQGRAIDQTRGDLASARTELTSSIARTHDELVVLQRRGQRSYFEFDLQKSKQFQREGPVGVSLRKANVKHQYADLQLMVDDRALTQKHVNLDQPVVYYQSQTDQPIQVVINEITKNHIHGYVSAPRYSESELTSMAPGNPPAGADQAASAGPPPPARRKLILPQ